jgi:hypothetical protein
VRRVFLAGVLGALACGPAACTVLVGLGPSPSEREEPDPGAGAAATDAGGGAFVDQGATLGDAMGATDASDATTTGSDGRDATDATDAISDRPLDAGPSLLLSSAAVLYLEGITSDGWVLYYDPSDDSVHALSLAGGSPLLLAAGTQLVAAKGKVAVLYQNTSPSRLTVWTSATGTHSQLYAADLFVSADSSRLLYTACDPPADAGCEPSRLMESDVDFSNPIDLGTMGDGQFDFGVTDDRFIVGRSFAHADGGSTYSCDAFSNTGTQVHLFDSPCSRAAGHAATSYLEQGDVLTALLTQSTSGGAIRSFSPVGSGDAGTITSFEITPDGGGVVFADGLGRLWSFSIAEGWELELANTEGFSSRGIGMAPDGTHFSFTDTHDVLLIASTIAGNPVAPHPLGDGSIGYPSTFSNDSRSFLFLEGNELELTSLDTNVTAHIADDVTCEKNQAYCFLPAHDSRVVYLSGGDLWAVDTQDLAHPRMLARSVVQFTLDPAGRTVVYRFKDSSMDNQSGLYSVVVP